jgi:act minimal PKS acyl carrier protein
MAEFSVHELKRLLREAAGEADGIDLDGDIGDQTFEELGYDSVSLLETSGLIRREYGVDLSDEALFEAGTPSALANIVSRELAAANPA